MIKNHEERYIVKNVRQLSGVMQPENKTTVALFGPAELEILSEMRRHRHLPLEYNYWMFVGGDEVQARMIRQSETDVFLKTPKVLS